MKSWWKKQKAGTRVFLLALGTAACMFLPAIIAGRGYFLLVGDFNSQQVPFYMLAHRAVRSGDMGWSWLTDLGSNFVTSYTFYLLGSPFFWLTIPFPDACVPYLMGPLLILKCACCALTAFWYLRRYVKNEAYAVIGAMLYAFCGFSIYNIFFNHFHDVMVFFPLLLMAVDELIDHNVSGAVTVSVALCALVNYFFFFGEVVFVLLYFIVRVCLNGYQLSFKRFLKLALEAVWGLLISAVLVLPSVLAILQNERLNNPLSGTNLWVFGKGRLLTIFTSYFLLPEFTSKQIYFDGAGTRWTSLSAYVPVFGLSAVFAYFRTKRDNWLKTLILILMVMSLVPILNSAFVAFNASFYARWFYMLVLMLILATVLALEEGSELDLRKGSLWVLGVTGALLLLIALSPNYANGELKDLGLFNRDQTVFFYFLGFLTLLLWCVSFFLIQERRHEKHFLRDSVIAIVVFALFFGNFYIFWGKSLAYDAGTYLIPDAIRGEEKVELPEAENYRIDSDNSLSNIGMFWDVPNIHCFHSIVPASIVSFYEFIGEERSVSSKIPESQYALRSFLSVRFYCDRIGVSDSFGSKTDPDADTLMPGYHYYDTMAGYDFWENDYCIPLGFVYDRYFTEEVLRQTSPSKYVNIMLKGVLLSEEQAERYADILTEIDSVRGELSYDNYYRDCRKLSQKTVKDFTRSAKGFSCSSDFAEDELVFFSVPWEEGWSAEVNGQPVAIEKVNVGFMAIRVPAGEAEIVFTYRTPGLRTGALCMLAGLVGLGIYLSLVYLSRKRGEKAQTEAPLVLEYVEEEINEKK